MDVVLKPDDLRILPIEDIVMPLPSPLTTPPVTVMYFICVARLTIYFYSNLPCIYNYLLPMVLSTINLTRTHFLPSFLHSECMYRLLSIDSSEVGRSLSIDCYVIVIMRCFGAGKVRRDG